MDKNLPELRDIHLPPPETVPLGVYMLAAVAAAFLLAAVLFLFFNSKYYRVRKKLRQLKKEDDKVRLIVGLSEALKEHFDQKNIFQKKWKKYLENRGLPAKTAQLLSEEIYRKSPPEYVKKTVLKEIGKII